MTLQFLLSSESNLCIELTCVMQQNYLHHLLCDETAVCHLLTETFSVLHDVSTYMFDMKGVCNEFRGSLRKITVPIWPPLAWLYVSLDIVRFKQEGTSFSNMSGLTGASSFEDKNMFLLLSLMAQPRLKACKCRYFEMFPPTFLVEGDLHITHEEWQVGVWSCVSPPKCVLQ